MMKQSAGRLLRLAGPTPKDLPRISGVAARLSASTGTHSIYRRIEEREPRADHSSFDHGTRCVSQSAKKPAWVRTPRCIQRRPHARLCHRTRGLSLQGVLPGNFRVSNKHPPAASHETIAAVRVASGGKWWDHSRVGLHGRERSTRCKLSAAFALSGRLCCQPVRRYRENFGRFFALPVSRVIGSPAIDRKNPAPSATATFQLQMWQFRQVKRSPGWRALTCF